MPFIQIRDGKIHSIKIEFNPVEHCNFSCAECSHFSPHLKARSYSLDSFQRELAALENVYHVGKFRFVGGEPFLHKDLLGFIEAVRSSGIADRIQICSNGSRIDRVSDAVFEHIDMLSISWYPDSRCGDEKIRIAKEKCKKHNVELKIEKIDRFRLMQLNEPISDDRLLNDLFETCQIAHSWYCQTFYDGYFYLCSRPLFTEAYLLKNNETAPFFKKKDGVSLFEDDLIDRLTQYLGRKSPLASCRYCLGTVGKYVPWRSLSTDERTAPALLDRNPHESISHGRMAYLRGWAKVEKGILSAFPSLAASRALNLLKNLPIRD